MNLSFNLITNNVNGLGDKQKRHQLFRRLQDQICHKGVIFMQETHSCSETQKNVRMNLEMEMNFFSVMVNRMQEVLRSGSVGI